MIVVVISAPLARLSMKGILRVRMMWMIERLGEEQLDEPAGLKELRLVPGVEGEQHEHEGRIIEDRADRPEIEHETRNAADIPLARLVEKFLVDIVGRDRRLREIIKQVVGQNLDRRHRQEGQEDARAEHAEHIAEIRARAHPDIF